MRHIWRVISTVEVLPLVPGDGDDRPPDKARRISPRARANRRRGSGSARCGTPATLASGRATTATAPLRDRLADEILAVEAAPLNAPKTLPARDLAMVDGKAGHFGIAVDAREVAQAHRINAPFFVDEGQHFGHIGLAVLVGAHAEHRRDPADGLADTTGATFQPAVRKP